MKFAAKGDARLALPNIPKADQAAVMDEDADGGD
jgi:hypothetical protein